MDKYHIYDQIGKGKHSVVYKGRRKGTIRYYAIKSVAKAQKLRVLQEVRIMHILDHENILKFFAWYETTNHLWLILEYAVGGDLLTLLRQDMRLPEASVHDFGRSLCAALQHLHSKGLLYCDLKPSNVLLDENGTLKLSDFGLGRRFADATATPAQKLPQSKRGTPCYMAPELFDDDGVHSTASDLWALGCVLYECAAGHPPFVAPSLTKLINAIANDEPTPLRGANVSAELNDLVLGLLVKDPARRLGWDGLVSHPFWSDGARLRPIAIPREPGREEYLKKLAERDAATSAAPAPAGATESPGTFEEPYASSPAVAEMPATASMDAGDKSAPKRNPRVDPLRVSRTAQLNLTRDEGRGATGDAATGEEGYGGVGDARQMTALTEQANSSNDAAKEASASGSAEDRVDYAGLEGFRALGPAEEALARNAAAAAAAAARKDVTTLNPDAEFDFAERPEPEPEAGDETGDESIASEAGASATMDSAASTAVAGTSAAEATTAQAQPVASEGGATSQLAPLAVPPSDPSPSADDNVPAPASDANLDPVTPRDALTVPSRGRTPVAQQSSTPPGATSASDGAGAANGDLAIRGAAPPVPRAPSGAGASRAAAAAAARAMSAEGEHDAVAHGIGDATSETSEAEALLSRAMGGESPAGSGSALPWMSKFDHDNDRNVRPIVLNRRIEKVPEPRFDARLLPFPPKTLEEALSLSQADLEAFLTQIYRSVGGTTGANEKINTLTYFETLCRDTAMANVTINSSLSALFSKALKASRVPALRARLAQVLGVLVRHATYIADELGTSGIVSALCDALRDRSEKVRRRSMAALGELLFYLATQHRERANAHAGGTDGAGKNGADASTAEAPAAQVPAAAIVHVTKMLRVGEDEIGAHYAAKTIENVACVGGVWSWKLCTQETLTSLTHWWTSSKSENFRGTAASAACRLCKFAPVRAAPLADAAVAAADGSGVSGPSAVMEGYDDVLPPPGTLSLHAALSLVVERVTPSRLAAFVSGGPNAGGSKGQQAALNVLVAALTVDITHAPRSADGDLVGSAPPSDTGAAGATTPGAPSGGVSSRLATSLLKYDLDAMCQGLVSALHESSASLSRGKACYAMLALMLWSRQWWTHGLARTRAAAAVEKAHRDGCAANDNYVVEACLQFRRAMGVSVQRAVADAASDAAALSAASAASGGPKGVANSLAAHCAFIGSAVALVDLTFHRQAILSDSFFASLGRALAVACGVNDNNTDGASTGAPAVPRASFTGQANLRESLLHLTESVFQSRASLLDHWESALRHVVPTLCDATASGCGADADAAFTCLKCTCDVLLTCLSEPRIYRRRATTPRGGGARAEAGTDDAGGSGGPGAGAGTGMVNALLSERFVPMLHYLLSCEEPVPLYALKLYGAAVEADSAFASEAAGHELVPLLLSFLELDHQNNNVHNVKLCRACLRPENATCTDAMLLTGAACVRVARVLCYAFDNAVEPFLEPAAGCVVCLLRRELAVGTSDAALPMRRTLLEHGGVETLVSLCGHADAACASEAAAALELFCGSSLGAAPEVPSPSGSDDPGGALFEAMVHDSEACSRVAEVLGLALESGPAADGTAAHPLAVAGLVRALVSSARSAGAATATGTSATAAGLREVGELLAALSGHARMELADASRSALACAPLAAALPPLGARVAAHA